MSSSPLQIRTGGWFTVKVAVSLLAQPLEPVTRTMYVPGLETVMHEVVAAVFHKYVKGATPPVTLAHNWAELPAQTAASST